MAEGTFAHRGLLYLHTLRHLKPAQLAWRVWRGVARPTTVHADAPALRPAKRPFVAPLPKPRSLVAADTLCLLNESRRVVGREDWDRSDWPALWVYNLHYFDDLCSA